MRCPNEFRRETLPAALQNHRPEWGIVLGSGLAGFVDRVGIVDALPYESIPGLPVSRVPGHAGRLVLAKIGAVDVVIAQGRVHLYEGRTAPEVCAQVRLMAALGVRRLVLTNAAGAINPAFVLGEWMAITDQLNLTGTSPLLGGAHFFDMTEVYSARLRQHFAAVAARQRVTLHEGVYAGLLGPQYETPAEVRMLRAVGADVVGMSTVLEAIQARALGMEVAGFSCVTNWAAGLAAGALAHEEVLATGLKAGAQLGGLLEAAFAGEA